MTHTDNPYPIQPVSPLLDPTATGVYLGGEESPISVLTLADWRQKGLGPDWIRVGRLIRYAKVDLDLWLENRKRKGA